MTQIKKLLYRAYLLRCWAEREVSAVSPRVWRFSLEDPRTGEKHGFGDFSSLMAFLQAQVAGNEEEESNDAKKGATL